MFKMLLYCCSETLWSMKNMDDVLQETGHFLCCVSLHFPRMHCSDKTW